MDNKIEKFVSDLFEIEVNIHIAHLQTSSFAEHKALDSLYKDIVDLRDRFIESYQGKFGIIKGYKSFSIQEGVNPITYLESFLLTFDEVRESLNDTSNLLQIIDDISELIYSTIYKLKFLK